MSTSKPEDWADQVRENLHEHAPPAPSAFRSTRYDLQERLGEGATAVVFAARDRELGREVAIKILREAVGMSDIARERFRREAQAAAGLSHPNLVTVYDAGSVEGQAYLVMERVQGKSLGDLLRERRPGDRELIRILERAARGVAAAHEKGIVHRDLKPANILISTAGDPKVGDFGMAHLMDSRMELTRTGVPLGTPLYMAPEQVQGRTQDITPRTDVYGLGAILYEMLAGYPPHMADSIVSLYAKVAQDEPVPPRKRNPAAPPELEAVALKALEKEPARRYADAALFADDLARFLDGKPVEARPASPLYRSWRRFRKHRWTVVAAAAALLAVAGVAFQGHRKARALEEERLREREVAEERLRRAAQTSLESARVREESLRRLSFLWGRMVAVQEWRKQASRKPSDIRQELEGIRKEVSGFIADYPDLPQGYYVRARAHFFEGDFLSAESDLTLALDRHPDFSPGWALLTQVKIEKYISRIYGWSNRVRTAKRLEAAPILREAEEAFRRFDGGAPGKAASERWGLSWTREDAVNEHLIPALKDHYLDKNTEQARARLQKALAESPAAEYYNFLANWSGNAKVGIPLFDQAIALAPNWARPYLDRSVALGVIGEREKAVEDLTRALDLNPNLAIAYDNRGYHFSQLQRYDEAIEDFTRALKVDPRMDSALAHRADARYAKKDFQGAVQDSSAAISIRSDFSLSWFIRSQSRMELGDLQAASSDIAKAIEVDSDEPEFYVQRALLSRARKDFEGMIKDLDKALQMAPPTWPQRSYIEGLRAEAKKQ